MMPAIVYQLAKTVHVLAAVMFLGFGLASFFYKALAFRSGSAAINHWVDRQIVLADWLFTVPAGVILPPSGAFLVWLYHLPWTTGWVVAGACGYLVAGLMWLPAARLQLVMRRMSEQAAAAGEPLPAAYGVAFRRWRLLGAPSFLGAMLAMWSMISKWLG
jgi:uncharacterized membrane protein